MSGSETLDHPAARRRSRVAKQLRRALRISWSTFRQSRLGTVGLIIVLVFALMAVLAPVIAPYPRLFEAPVVDRFSVHAYSVPLAGNQTYANPVMGPTTPFLPDLGGGMWDVNWNATHASVYMNFLRYVVSGNMTPFEAGNASLSFDATQMFNVTPLPAPPIRSLYWIAPGLNVSNSMGPSDRNGALAYFMGNDFIVGDPFTKTLVFSAQVPFTPVWTGEDPESAGNLLAYPKQELYAPIPGAAGTPYGPYRYFYASDGNHTIVYEVTWVHTGDQTPQSVPGGRIALWDNTTLAAPPFVYYDWSKLGPTGATGYRQGLSQSIILPLTNDTLAVYNVSGKLRAYVPLSLFGVPATVSGSIGYSRSTDTASFLLYVPLRSSNASGIATLNMADLTVSHVYGFPKASLDLLGTPVSYKGYALYLGLYDASADSTLMLGLNVDPQFGNLTIIPQFQVPLPGPVGDYFEVDELKQIFLFPPSHKILEIPTTFSSTSLAAVTPVDFGLPIPPGVPDIVYGGTFKGTLYGINLATTELSGAWTDSSTGTTTVFTLLGKLRAPLPPGTYTSGNYYPLGTDFNGHDILTQLLYGTQIAFVVGILAALFGVGIGTFVGVIAGYYGRLVDTLLMRTTDVFLVLPFLPIVLVLVSIVRPSIWIIIFVLSILGWPGIARVIRAQVLSLKERPFVDAARVAGASDMRLIFLHLAPNVLPFSFLYMSLGVAGAIITEAALSYLGLGDPNVTSWGGMLSNLITQGGGLYYWWWLVPPGLAITFICLGFYMVGRGFDEIINPRLRRR